MDTHDNASETVSVGEAARFLAEQLGPKLVAITIGSDSASVEAWARREAKPHPAEERRLRIAYGLWHFVSSVESHAMVRVWWMGMKDGLDDLSPAEAIAAGRESDVQAVARSFVEGG